MLSCISSWVGGDTFSLWKGGSPFGYCGSRVVSSGTSHLLSSRKLRSVGLLQGGNNVTVAAGLGRADDVEGV